MIQRVLNYVPEIKLINTSLNSNSQANYHVNKNIHSDEGIFSSLSNDQIEIVSACSKKISLNKKEILFRQGEIHKSVFIIQSGIVRTDFTSINAREITLAYWQKNNIVGTPTVLSEKKIRQWSGEAVTKCEVLEIKSLTLRALLVEFPSIAISIIEALEYKGECLSRVIQMLGTMDVTERILDSLKALGSEYGVELPNGVLLCAPFTHEAIAGMVGASRQWVTIELNKLQKQGFLHLNKRTILIYNNTSLIEKKLKII